MATKILFIHMSDEAFGWHTSEESKAIVMIKEEIKCNRCTGDSLAALSCPSPESHPFALRLPIPFFNIYVDAEQRG